VMRRGRGTCKRLINSRLSKWLMVQGSGANYKKRKEKKEKKRKGRRKETRRKGKTKEKKEVEKEGLRRSPVQLLVDAIFASLFAAPRRF
jgi:hypothetical protein